MFDPRPDLYCARADYAAILRQARAAHDKPAADEMIARIDDIDAFIDAMPEEPRHARH